MTAFPRADLQQECQASEFIHVHLIVVFTAIENSTFDPGPSQGTTSGAGRGRHMADNPTMLRGKRPEGPEARLGRLATQPPACPTWLSWMSKRARRGIPIAWSLPPAPDCWSPTNRHKSGQPAPHQSVRLGRAATNAGTSSQTRKVDLALTQAPCL
jgi:hypothetical protein